jgi:hypothetical protein
MVPAVSNWCDNWLLYTYVRAAAYYQASLDSLSRIPTSTWWFALMTLFLVLTVLYLVRKQVPQPAWRKKAMSKKERAVYVRKLLADKICESLLDAQMKDELTQDEAVAYAARIAKGAGIPDLLPRFKQNFKPNPSLLKAEIKERLETLKTTGRAPIPEPAAPKPTAKKFFSAFRRG